MIVNEQKQIELKNECGCICRETDLEGAILWYSRNLDKPVQRLKRVFLYGSYPAVSIRGQKIHVHRLLWAYWSGRFPSRREYVHHKNGNKLDNRRENLELMYASEHQSISNKGRKQSPEWIKKRITKTANAKRGKKYPKIYENPELLNK